MTLQTVGLGTGPDTPGADSLYQAFTKVNAWAQQLVPVFSPRAYGAVASGSSTPLSTKYATLAAAQAAYPFATALTQEIDFCAVQAAINAAQVAGGGVVALDAASYVMTQAGTTTDTLVFPECRELGFSPAGTRVDLIGQGRQVTKLLWNRDLGSGAFAIACGDPTATLSNGLGRYAETAMYIGLWADFSIQGPTAQGALGVAFTQMSGFCWGARRRMSGTMATLFWAGLDIVGDHTPFYDVSCQTCYYPLYFNEASTALYGDLAFFSCMFSGGSMAAVGIHPNGLITGTSFTSCYFAYSPYGIFKEAGTVTRSGADQFLTGSHFVKCNCENLGNGFITDDNGFSSTKTGKVGSTTFDCCYVSWNDAKKLTTGGRDRFAAVDINQANGLYFRNMNNGLTPGTQAVFKIDSIGSFWGGALFSGDAAGVLAACTSANVPFLHNSVINGTERFFKVEHPGCWEGFCLKMQTSVPQAPIAGDVIEYAWDLGTIGGFQLTNPVAGIAQHATSATGVVVVASRSNSITVNTGAVTVNNNNYLRKGLSVLSAAVSAGGTGYAVNDVLTVSGGTKTTAATLTVTSVSGGVVTGVSVTNAGVISAMPANPAAVTGGTGTGATFTLTPNYGKVVQASGWNDTIAPPFAYCIATGGSGTSKTAVVVVNDGRR